MRGSTCTAARRAKRTPRCCSFSAARRRNGARYVLVITGKGRAGSDGLREAGVLKRQVPQWLAMPEFRGYVVGFEDAAASHGGEGALYVRLRRGR